MPDGTRVEVRQLDDGWLPSERVLRLLRRLPGEGVG